ERPPLEHPEVRLSMADETVELDEGARVAQLLGALAGEELAGSALLLDRLFRTRVGRALTLLAQPLELLLRRLVRHEREATVAGWNPTARRSGPTTSAANPAASPTRATHIRQESRPRNTSARSRAATRSCTP